MIGWIIIFFHFKKNLQKQTLLKLQSWRVFWAAIFPDFKQEADKKCNVSEIMGLDHHNPPHPQQNRDEPSSSQSGTSQKWSVVSGFDREKRNLRWAGAGWLDVGVWKTLAHQSKSSVIRRNTGVFFPRFHPPSSWIPFVVEAVLTSVGQTKQQQRESAVEWRKYHFTREMCCCWVLAGLLNLNPGNFVSWFEDVGKTSLGIMKISYLSQFNVLYKN